MGIALPALWARALVALRRDYEAGEGVPPLPLSSNLLRVVGDDATVRLADAPRLARLSRRTMSQLVTHGERAGLVVVDRSGGRGRAMLRLTGTGTTAREASRATLRHTEGDWDDRLGSPVERLRDGLEALVGQLDLELPHYPMGYGPVDNSVTGGASVASPGKDWRPVARAGPDTAAGLSLSALLSQAVVAFAIDYESEGGLTLPTAAVLQAVGPSGAPVAGLPPLWALRGHDIHTVAPAPTGRGKVLRLTARGESFRDAYGPVTAAIERTWRHRFGPDLIADLRATSESLAHLLPSAPASPDDLVASLIAR